MGSGVGNCCFGVQGVNKMEAHWGVCRDYCRDPFLHSLLTRGKHRGPFTYSSQRDRMVLQEFCYRGYGS